MRRCHAEVGSPLAAIGLRLEVLREDKNLDPRTRSAMDSISAELALVIDSVRASVAELRLLRDDSEDDSGGETTG